MKKVLFFIFLLPGVALSRNPAEQEHIISDLSGGMNSYVSPNMIPLNTAAYLQNFYSDIEPSGVERKGYVKRDGTVLGGAAPVTGLWRLQDNTGVEWIISFSSRTYYKNTAGSTPTSLGWTVTSDNVPTCTANIGKLWCVNGVDPLQWFDGTSTGSVASAPKGRLIAPWRSHVVIGNIASELSTLYVSANNDGTNWTPGINATDPFIIYVGGANNGEYVRCMSPGLYMDMLVIGQKYATWGLSGFTQADWQLRNISAEVGCIENGSMKEFDGSLMFLSARGLEEMRGTQIQLVSEPVRNYTDMLVKNSASQRRNIQTTQADWGAGTADTYIYVDTETAPGMVQFTYPDTFDTLRNGLSGTKNVWTTACKGVSVCTTTAVIDGGSVKLTTTDGTNGQDQILKTTGLLENYAPGTTYYISISSMTPKQGSTGASQVYFVLSSSNNPTSTVSPTSLPNYFWFAFTSTAANQISLNAVKSSDDLFLCAAPCSATPVSLPAVAQIYLSTTGYAVTLNDSLVTSGAHTYTNQRTYAYFDYFSQNALNGSIYIDQFGVAPQTFTYTSQIFPIGTLITSWSNTTISDVKTSSASISYQFGSAATQVTPTNFQAASNGYVPTVSTQPYAAFKASFTTVLTSGTAQLADYMTTWNEGGLAPSPVSGIYDRRYWLSFTTGTSGTLYQDTVLVYQRNRTFSLLKGINAASFTYPLWRDKLYFGNSNGNGYVYEYDVGNNDDGSEMVSQIHTRSYDMGLPIQEKDFRNAWPVYTGNTGFSGNFNLAYFLDRSTTSFNLGTVNMNDGTGQLAPKMPFPLTNAVQGREIQYVLTKQGTGDRLKLHGITTRFTVKEER